MKAWIKIGIISFMSFILLASACAVAYNSELKDKELMSEYANKIIESIKVEKYRPGEYDYREAYELYRNEDFIVITYSVENFNKDDKVHDRWETEVIDSIYFDEIRDMLGNIHFYKLYKTLQKDEINYKDDWYNLLTVSYTDGINITVNVEYDYSYNLSNTLRKDLIKLEDIVRYIENLVFF